MIAVTSSQMRDLDRRTIEERGIPADTLMENAGRGIFEEIKSRYSPIAGRKVAVVCGKGNNGGDGLVVARYLREAGAETTAFLLADPSSLKGETRSNLERFKKIPGRLVPLQNENELQGMRAVLNDCDMIVDAIFGTGLSSEVRGLPAGAVAEINHSGKPVVSVDLPSGINSDTGNQLGCAVKADLTVTFALPKRGHLIGEGIDHTGTLRVVDIGIPADLIRELPSDLIFWTAREAREHLRTRPPASHKGSHGHVLVIGGSTGKGGAAVMAGLSALRTGAGLVTLAWPGSLEKTVPNRPFELMTFPLAETADGSLGPEALDPILKFSQDKTVVALGPGLSTHPETTQLVRDLVLKLEIPMVIDADGLNALVGKLDLIKKARGSLILTPHPGEMARLLGTSSKEVQSDRIGSVSRMADEVPAVWVLKGARTIVAESGTPPSINSTGSPAMATGGTGDVLTGVIAALTAQGYSPSDAARLGVYLHGLAGDIAAREIGSVGLVAGDLIERLPHSIREVQAE